LILTTLLVITVSDVIDFIDGCQSYMSLISGVDFVFKRHLIAVIKMIAVALFMNKTVIVFQ